MDAGTITVKINGDATNLQSALTKMNSQLGKVQDTAKSAASGGFKQLAASMFTAQAAFALAQKTLRMLFDTVKQGINLAKDLNEEQNKFNVVFRGSIPIATKLRNELTSLYGMSRVEATRAMAAFQDFLVPMGIARGKATELSGAFNKLAVDIGSFNNAPTAQVVDAIKSALAGMSRPLRQFGVDVSDSALKQLALAKGIEVVGDKLDNQTRAMLIYEKISKDSADAMGDFARTSGDLANMQKILQARNEDVITSLGQAFLPVVRDVTVAMLDASKSISKWLDEAKNIEALQNAVKGIAFTFFLIAKAVQLNYMLIKEFIDLSLTGFTALKQLLSGLFKGELRKGFRDSFDTIKQGLAETGGDFANWGKSIANQFKQVTTDFDEAMDKTVNNAEESTVKTGGFIKSKAKEVMEVTSQMAAEFGGAITQVFSLVGSALDNEMNNRLQRMQNSYNQQIEMMDAALAREIELITYNGITKEEYQQEQLALLQERLKAETDTREQEDLQQEISAIQKEMAIENANKKALKNKEKAEMSYAKKKYQLEVALFNQKKGMDIANVWMSAGQGIVAAWAGAAGWPGPSVIAGMVIAGILSGLITTMAGVQTGFIASQQPPAPAFAKGGIVDRPQLVMAGERGPEAILPAELTQLLMNTARGGGSQTINLVVDGDILRTWSINNQRREAYLV